MLHVLGLPSGKDIQRPARFLSANARWSSPIGVDTMLYAATSGGCGGAPNGVWAIDLDSELKPVVSWKTNGGPVVGAVAFAPDGTLFAAIGAGRAAGNGRANAIVALDPKTLQLKDWFTQAAAEFVTGPTILRHGDKDIVAAATKTDAFSCSILNRLAARTTRHLFTHRRRGWDRERRSAQMLSQHGASSRLRAAAPLGFCYRSLARWRLAAPATNGAVQAAP